MKKMMGLMMTVTALLSAQQSVVWWYEGTSPAHQQALLEEMQDAFNQQNTKYRLTIEFKSDLRKDINLALSGKSGPDIVQTWGPSYVNRLAKAGRLASLDSYARRYNWQQRLIDSVYRVGLVDKQLYSLPKTIESLGMFYNKEVFAANGWQVPTTKAELFRLFESAKGKGMLPLAIGNQGWPPANEHYFSVMLNSVAGPQEVYKVLTGAEKWNSPAIEKAFQELNLFFDSQAADIKKYFSISGESAIQSVLNGTSAIALTGTWAFQWVDEKSEDLIGFAPMVRYSNQIPYPLFPIGIGATLSINAYSENKDGAAAVLDFMLGEAFYRGINARWPGEWAIPLRQPPKPERQTPALDAVQQITASLNTGGFGYTSWTFFPPETNQELIKGIEEVWLGKQDLVGMLNRVDRKAKREMRRGGLPPVIEP